MEKKTSKKTIMLLALSLFVGCSSPFTEEAGTVEAAETVETGVTLEEHIDSVTIMLQTGQKMLEVYSEGGTLLEELTMKTSLTTNTRPENYFIVNLKACEVVSIRMHFYADRDPEDTTIMTGVVNVVDGGYYNLLRPIGQEFVDERVTEYDQIDR